MQPLWVQLCWMDDMGHDEQEPAVPTSLRADPRLPPGLVGLGPAVDSGAQTAVGQTAGHARHRHAEWYPCCCGAVIGTSAAPQVLASSPEDNTIELVPTMKTSAHV